MDLLRSRKLRPLLLIQALVWVLLTVSCHRAPAPPSLILLISIDTLRADHLGCYGYDRPTSPNLDRFAGDGLLFERAFSHAPSTLVAHASLMSSLLPQHHGASHRFRHALPERVLTVAEVLRDAGWSTFSVNGGGQMAADFGIDQGFETWHSLKRKDDTFSRVVDLALDYLDRPAEAPRFLFLHTYEVHSPLEPPDETLRLFNTAEPGTEPQEPAWTVDRYDAEIRSMDQAFGRLESELRRRDLWHDAVVIVTSDHGEEMGERGQWGVHAHTLHDELLRVPLLVKPPGWTTGERRTLPVRLVDVAPTVLGLAGIEPPELFDGVDLLAPDAAPGPLVANQDTATVEPIDAWRNHRWKWIGGRLFDLDADPGETRDVADEHPDLSRDIERRIERQVSSRTAYEPRAAEPSAEVESQLRALGYADGGP